MLGVILATLICAAPATDALELRAKTDALFAEWNIPDSPGCAVAVYRDGAIVYERGFGQASLELSVPITPQTVFDIGSTSKQFTAACIGLLALDKQLGLDDDIRKFLPEMPELAKPITVRHLLNHTSGLRDYIEVMLLAGFRIQDRTTCAETYAAITRQKTGNFAPGERHLYSNTGYFLLAQIVERVSKKSLRDFARERIFDPLEMKHTEILDDCTHVVRNKANSYSVVAGGFATETSDWEQTGDGAVQTTVGDLQRWDENFYTGKVGGPELKAILLTRGKLNDGAQLDYCAGLVVGEQRGLATVRHGGSWVGFRAEFLRFPAQHVSVVCLCNLGSMNPSALADRVAEVWLAAEMSHDPRSEPGGAADTRPAVKIEAQHLVPLVGRYVYDDIAVRIELDNDALTVSGTGVRPGRLTPLGNQRFRREGGGTPLDVVFSSDSMRFEFRDGRRWEFKLSEEWKPAAGELARFVGNYWSDEVGAALELEIVEGVLTVVRHRTLDTLQLTPFSKDSFTCDLGRLTFRTAQQKVSGFTIDGGRARGLTYERR
ncbi:MAG: beta-lactamase family protein [Planctomycetes bacterium]|nr:beta-lactamase family protein [Planctomycetota bacterium]